MARPRHPYREEAKRRWLESDGKTPLKEIAAAAGVGLNKVSEWKKVDGWLAALEKQRSKRKRGAQPGNKNALGGGAPYRNANAEKHGAYSTVHLDDLSPEERAYIESIGLDTVANMTRELQLLTAKEMDLRRRIKALEAEQPETLHTDKVVEMLVPKAQQDGAEGDTQAAGENLKTALRTIIQASPFDRQMKLEAELNKTHGRIIKLLDSIKGYELEARRIELEERKYRLAKQRATGEYSVDPDTGEIDDATDDGSDDGPEI